jgi:hypothetical protein
VTLEQHKIFFKKVTLMRHHQRLYVQFRSSQDLEKMKRLQREVDVMIKAEVREQKSKQLNLI